MHILKRGSGEFLLTLCGHAERAVVQHFAAAAVAFDNAVAGGSRRGRIDTQHSKVGIRAVRCDHRNTVYGLHAQPARGLSRHVAYKSNRNVQTGTARPERLAEPY